MALTFHEVEDLYKFLYDAVTKNALYHVADQTDMLKEDGAIYLRCYLYITATHRLHFHFAKQKSLGGLYLLYAWDQEGYKSYTFSNVSDFLS